MAYRRPLITPEPSPDLSPAHQRRLRQERQQDLTFLGAIGFWVLWLAVLAGKVVFP